MGHLVTTHPVSSSITDSLRNPVLTEPLTKTKNTCEIKQDDKIIYQVERKFQLQRFSQGSLIFTVTITLMAQTWPTCKWKLAMIWPFSFLRNSHRIPDTFPRRDKIGKNILFQ